MVVFCVRITASDEQEPRCLYLIDRILECFGHSTPKAGSMCCCPWAWAFAQTLYSVVAWKIRDCYFDATVARRFPEPGHLIRLTFGPGLADGTVAVVLSNDHASCVTLQLLPRPDEQTLSSYVFIVNSTLGKLVEHVRPDGRACGLRRLKRIISPGATAEGILPPTDFSDALHKLRHVLRTTEDLAVYKSLVYDQIGSLKRAMFDRPASTIQLA